MLRSMYRVTVYAWVYFRCSSTAIGNSYYAISKLRPNQKIPNATPSRFTPVSSFSSGSLSPLLDLDGIAVHRRLDVDNGGDKVRDHAGRLLLANLLDLF